MHLMPLLSRLTIGALLLWGLVPIAADPDAFWHLRLGRDLLAGEGAIIGPEALSPLSSAIIVDHSWLHGVLLAIGERIAGVDGATVVAWIPFIGLILGSAHYLRLRSPDTPWYDRLLALTVIAVAARPVTLPRAGTYDAFFGVLLLVILIAPRRASLMALPLLTIAWAALHGAGLLIGVPLLLAGWPALRARPELRRPALIGIAGSLFAVILMPGALASALYPLAVTASAAQRAWISEWQSPLALSSAAMLPAAALGLLVLVGLLRGRGRDLRGHELLLGLPLIVAALFSTRWVLLACFIGVLLLLPATIAGLRRTRIALDHTSERVVGIALATVVVLIALSRIAAVAFGGTQAAIAARYPVSLAPVAATCGPLVAPYDWGGYLIAHGVEQVALYGEAGALEAGGVDLAAWFEAEAGLRAALPLLDAAGLDVAISAEGAPLGREIAAAGWQERLSVPGEGTLYLRPGSDCR